MTKSSKKNLVLYTLLIVVMLATGTFIGRMLSRNSNQAKLNFPEDTVFANLVDASVLYSKPSTKSTEIGYLTKEDMISIVSFEKHSKDSYWYKVSTRLGTGFIDSSNLELINIDSQKFGFVNTNTKLYQDAELTNLETPIYSGQKALILEPEFEAGVSQIVAKIDEKIVIGFIQKSSINALNYLSDSAKTVCLEIVSPDFLSTYQNNLSNYLIDKSYQKNLGGVLISISEYIDKYDVIPDKNFDYFINSCNEIGIPYAFYLDSVPNSVITCNSICTAIDNYNMAGNNNLKVVLPAKPADSYVYEYLTSILSRRGILYIEQDEFSNFKLEETELLCSYDDYINMCVSR